MTIVSTARLRRIEDLPSPRGWPVLGNMLQVKAERIHLDFETWARQFGPLFRVRLGSVSLLVVAGHEAVLAVLRARPDVFRRSARLREIGDEMGEVPGLFSSEGQAWRNQRRMVMAAFSPEHVRGYFPTLLRVAQRLHARWQKASNEGAWIDLQSDLKRFTVDAIAGLAFGTDVNSLETNDDPIHRHLDIILAGFYRRVMSPLPYWRWIKRPADRQLERSVAALRAAIGELIEHGRSRLQAEPALRVQPRNLLEAMIAAADLDGTLLSDGDVAGNVSTMLMAGEDTTANTLAWLIYLLKANPDALRKAQDEVRRIAPEPTGFTLQQMERLDYVGACAAEAMRLKPVAPFLGLETLCETVIADVSVPAGTEVWCVLRHDSTDESHVPHALAFQPERWLTEDAPKHVSMPFGAGPRMCPGRYLAMLEIKTAMSVLLGSFELDDVQTLDGGEPRETMAFTMNPTPMRMRLRLHVNGSVRASSLN